MRAVWATLALLIVCTATADANERLVKLAAGLRSAEQSERYAAYNALRREKSPALIGVLLDVLPDCTPMGEFYGMLLLQQQPDRKRVKPALRRLIGSKSVHLRVLAAAQLHRMGERDAGKVIAKALADEAIDSSRKTLLLTRIYGIRDEAVQSAVRALLVADGHAGVLAQALYDVYMVRDKAALDAVRALDAHADAGVRALAAGCLLVLGDAAGTERLAKAIRAGGLTSGHVYKLKGMLEAAKPIAEVILAACLERMENEEDSNVLRALLDFLGAQRYGKAAGAIRKLLDHSNSMVSKAAFTALTRLPGAVTPETMRELLAGDNDARRLAAVEALRRADDATGLPVALAILKDGKSDADRWEAARVLGGFRTSKVVVPLLDVLMDKNQTVRSNAYSSLATVLRSLFPYRRFDLAATGYITTGSAASRKAAVQKLRAWWSANRTRDW